jgi:hypothetical protein
MSLPCEYCRRKDEVPMTTSTPSTPVRTSQPRGKVGTCDHRRTGLDGDARVVHVTPDVGEHLGLEAELANGLAVAS